jgi:hypothetical protein
MTLFLLKCRAAVTVDAGIVKKSLKCVLKARRKWLKKFCTWHTKRQNIFILAGGNSLANGLLLRELIRGLEAQKLSVQLCLVGRPEDVLRHHDILERVQSSTIRTYLIEGGIEANTQHLLDLLGRRNDSGNQPQGGDVAFSAAIRYSPRTNFGQYDPVFAHDMTIEDLSRMYALSEYTAVQEM